MITSARPDRDAAGAGCASSHQRPLPAAEAGATLGGPAAAAAEHHRRDRHVLREQRNDSNDSYSLVVERCGPSVPRHREIAPPGAAARRTPPPPTTTANWPRPRAARRCWCTRAGGARRRAATARARRRPRPRSRGVTRGRVACGVWRRIDRHRAGGQRGRERGGWEVGRGRDAPPPELSAPPQERAPSAVVAVVVRARDSERAPTTERSNHARGGERRE